MRYEFNPSGNKIIDDLLKKFDNQIRIEYKQFNGNKDDCPSYIHKCIFLETLDFNINDWRKIREGNYWEIRDNLDGINQSKFILERVRDYQRNYN
tara:strand:+ start:1238 stop:1522 length:285 start_codon:yes stop_codon:yes gene_type:complete